MGMALPIDPTNATLILDAALAYAANGKYVFPIAPDTKRPAVKCWQDVATTDPKQIRTWWMANPEYNIGWVPAKSGEFIVDLDCKRADVNGLTALEALEAKYGKLPDGPVIVTPSGGQHRIFKGVMRTEAGGIAPGIDIRGGDVGEDGKVNGAGYGLLPPSTVDG